MGICHSGQASITPLLTGPGSPSEEAPLPLATREQSWGDGERRAGGPGVRPTPRESSALWGQRAAPSSRDPRGRPQAPPASGLRAEAAVAQEGRRLWGRPAFLGFRRIAPTPAPVSSLPAAARLLLPLLSLTRVPVNGFRAHPDNAGGPRPEIFNTMTSAVTLIPNKVTFSDRGG